MDYQTGNHHKMSKVSGELNVEMFLNQISNEVGIRDVKIFNTDGKEQIENT